jgi:hypothetical protein
MLGAPHHPFGVKSLKIREELIHRRTTGRRELSADFSSSDSRKFVGLALMLLDFCIA